MRRVVVPLILVAVAIALFFVLRHRKQQLIAAQICLLQSEDPTKSEAARKVLQRIGRSAVRPVCALLDNPEARVQRIAALTLANIGDPAAGGPLMEAAKRGGFAAADALKAMKHPQSSEARAWAYCWLAERKLEEFRAGLPVGGRPERLPAVRWHVSHMYRPFDGATAIIQKEPEARYCPEYRDWTWTVQEPNRADAWCGLAEQYGPLPEGYIGRARVYELCGDYGTASHYYKRALELAPTNEAARSAEAQVEQLLKLVRQMRPLLPEGYVTERVLTHPTWTHGDATYYIAVATLHQTRLDLGSSVPKLVLFKHGGGPMELLDTVSVFSAREEASAWNTVWPPPPGACVGVVPPGTDGERAMVAAVRALASESRWPRWRGRYEVILYALEPGALVRELRVPSAAMPWVTDIDDDGDAEIITWHSPLAAWPVVQTLVDGRYETRTEQFPSVFEGVPSVLENFEPGEDVADPNLPDYAGRAYEILGQRALAIEAYRRAERKYRERADQLAAKGQEWSARDHRQGAAAARDRRLRLEAAKCDSSTPQ